jgi:dTDP-4-amino-4,6-dideoxygalactose transaminase
MADMDPILDLAEEHKLIVIEDACQAHGAEYFSKAHGRWMKAGTMGSAAAFSFYPGKNLGACGEGGAVTTDDSAVAAKIRMLRDHGQMRKYHHDLEGYNGRLDAVQAGILLAKLPYLSEWNLKRRCIASEYDRLLAGNKNITIPSQPSWSRSVYHLYVIRSPERMRMIEHLTAARIGSGCHYPLPLHMQKAYESLNYSPDDLPVASRVAAEILSLPMFPQLTCEQQARVSEQVLAFMPKVAPATSVTTMGLLAVAG